ncbi:MAG: cyclic nucleotide-binding domain-containing protein [Acidimicrobiia bacterium]|nr:cyclic nucleotide-binding domain-containing protein [Acidimicrobiia bacterium]
MRKVLYLFGVLEETDIDWLARNGEKQYLEPGTVLIREGEPVGSLFLVLEGGLEVKRSNGARVATLLSGEIVGEISFVDARPPSATVQTMEASHVLAVDRERLKAKLAADAAFASRFYLAIAVFLADRLRATTSQLGYGSPAQDQKAPDEIDDTMMDAVSVANVRFDNFIKTLRLNR